MRDSSRWPSPALVIAALALAFAVAGTAVAGTDAVSKLTKAKVKTIAKAQIEKAAPGLSVANAANAANADNADKLGGQQPGAYASSASEAYREIGDAGQPVFQNGYVNAGGGYSTAAFYKDPLGVVHLKGTILGTSGSIAFTLPTAYRPAANLILPIAADGPAAANMIITSAGDVTPYKAGGGMVLFGIDGISFRAGS